MANIYFIGIKGAGMSALANILKALGNNVVGSDIESYVFTQDALISNGIRILPFSVTNMENKYDVIIKGNAFHATNNAEVAYLEQTGICYTSYYEFLAAFLGSYTSIAVSGTHGKTTTTGLLAQGFSHENLACLIGDGTGMAQVDAKYFLFEACEYKRHFLWYEPTYLIITNIEFDHPDYFEDIDDVIEAFTEAANRTKQIVIAYGDDLNVQKLQATMHQQKMLTYGFLARNDYQILDYQPTNQGFTFRIKTNFETFGPFELPFFGKHMLLNAVSTIVVGHLEKLNLVEMVARLALFNGVKRRFNIEEVGSEIFVDDYAHHPTEIRVTLEAARQKFPTKQVITIFQPHTFSRTNTLANDFAEALKGSDEIYVTDIFASAREKNEDTVPTVLLTRLKEAKRLTFDNISDLTLHTNSVFIFMGAGNIHEYYQKAKEFFQK
ncbi:MAG: UDP-N-acetylmuramate--L-alanine ligase [Culicoidibacterales bacterium]